MCRGRSERSRAMRLRSNAGTDCLRRSSLCRKFRALRGGFSVITLTKEARQNNNRHIEFQNQVSLMLLPFPYGMGSAANPARRWPSGEYPRLVKPGISDLFRQTIHFTRGSAMRIYSAKTLLRAIGLTLGVLFWTGGSVRRKAGTTGATWRTDRPVRSLIRRQAVRVQRLRVP